MTVTDLVSSETGTDLTYEFTGLEGDKDEWCHEKVRFLSGGRELGGRATRSHTSVRPGKLVRGLVAGPLPPDLREVELELSGGLLGDWTFPLELVAFPSDAATEATRVEASDTREGITVSVRAMALTPDATVLQLEVFAEPPVRMIAGIGGFDGLREESTALTLRDQAGHVYPERPTLDARDRLPDQTGSGDVAFFDPLPADAENLELEVPIVLVEDSTEPASIDLPVTQPTDVRLGRYGIKVLSTRVADPSKPWHRGPALAVELDLGGWQDERRVLKPWQAQVDGAPCGVGFGGGMHGPAPEPLRYIELRCGDPESARTLSLSGATVQVRGPWRMRFRRSRR